MPRETKGVTIRGISLQRSVFEWLANADTQASVSALPAEQQVAHLETDVTPQLLLKRPPEYLMALTVKLRGMVAQVVFWELEATFQGDFVREADSEISEADLLQIHGPAWLYSFAREFASDVTRRANIGSGVMLPPVNFQAGPTKK